MHPASHPLAVPPEQLRARSDPASFGFANTAALPPPQRLTGQDRAAEALVFGLEVPDSRYNIFVAGPPGSGRSVSTVGMVEALAASQPVPSDWVYVHNFAKPYEPRAIEFPAGQAVDFAHAVEGAIDAARQALRDAFDAEAYRRRRAAAVKEVEEQRERLSKEFEARAEELGFAVQPGEDGPNFIPLKPAVAGEERQTYPPDEFSALSDADKEQFRANYDNVQEAFASAAAANRRLVVQERALLREVDTSVAREAILPVYEALRARFAPAADVRDYFDQVVDDVIANTSRLRADGDEKESAENAAEGGEGIEQMMRNAQAAPLSLIRYRVNVLVDRVGETHAPAIHEHNPTYYNLAGRLEYGTRMGNLFTDFSFIKSGALHRANGGFLIIHARELLSSPKAWEVLKRSLRTGTITIENPVDPQQAVALAASLKPAPIPLRVKVLLLGDYETWNILNDNDPDFAEMFKVRADFDAQMPRNSQTEGYYAQFVGDVARSLDLPPLTPAAVALIIEEGSRIAEDQTKLSTSLTTLRDLVIEASYWARKTGLATIEAATIDQATKMRRRRLGIGVDRIDESIRRGALKIAVAGQAVGQINGLAVITTLGAIFGRPMRITARAAPGVAGVVDVEREVQLSGPIHSKGVLTISGYLAGRYGQEQPLSLAATITFEQVYDGVDGDSASLAELCALLSTLSDVPIRQDLAVTGSVNQYGEVQAVGGVTAKVEGFFDTCAILGLNGTQGVIIPAANVRNLMLRLDIIEAVRRGAFQIYAVHAVDEAVELLMWRPAGRPNPQGEYLSNTINALVIERLQLYAERVRRFRQNGN